MQERRASPRSTVWIEVANARAIVMRHVARPARRRTDAAPASRFLARNTIADHRGNPLLVKLAKPVLASFNAYNWQQGPGLFGRFTFRYRRSAYKELAAACKAAGIQYYPLHKAGRHAFARRLLDAGYSTSQVMVAGKWCSSRLVNELYGHYAHSEVDDATRAVSEEWASSLEDAEVSKVITFGPKRA
jgi:integrase